MRSAGPGTTGLQAAGWLCSCTTAAAAVGGSMSLLSEFLRPTSDHAAVCLSNCCSEMGITSYAVSIGGAGTATVPGSTSLCRC